MERGKYSKSLAVRLLLTSVATVGAWISSAYGTQSTQQEVNFQSNPVLNVSSSTPLVMLNLSKDQLLFFKAYNDFSALDPNLKDGNGVPIIETTYFDSIDYYGYFDSAKCYTYVSNVFTPASTVTGYVNSSTPLTSHRCSGQWSGNFLNWSSMTRMDAVRKLLYGGLRSTDGTSTTVLERAFLPTDAHAFAKYYNGSDLASFVPFVSGSDFKATALTTTTSFTASPLPLGYGGSPLQISFNINVASAAGIEIGDQLCLYYNKSGPEIPCVTSPDGTVTVPTSITTPFNTTGDNTHGFIYGGVSNISGTTITVLVYNPSASTATLGANCTTATPCVWQVVNLSSPGISMCSVSDPGTNSGYLSQSISTPPLLRVVKGNRALWGANEQLQCLWSSEHNNTQSGFTGGFRSNGNRAFYSSFGANAENSDQTRVALGTGSTDPATSSAAGTYYVRVVACPGGGLDANEKCETYGAGNEKPIGLLQTYAESGQIKFGLITGSFQKNISGGVVRKNLPASTINGVNSLTDEISSGTTGTGQFLPIGTNGSIIGTLNALKPYGYKFETGDSWGDGDGCPYQLSSVVHSGASGSQVNEGNCSSWGSPLSEGYLESIRYLAGLAATPSYTFTNTGSRDAALGLPQPAWPTTANAVLDANNYCASLNVMNFNSSIESYDSYTRDSAYYSTFSDLNLTVTNGSFPTGSGANGWTREVGDLEGISGQQYFIGQVGGTTDGMCSAKTIADLSQASGLCPEAPAKQGAYIMAGIAYAAHTQRIRNDITGIPATDSSSLKVTTYGVQLASNTPKIQVPKGDGTATIAFQILPAYRLDLGGGDGVTGPFGGGTLVDFRVVHQDPSTCVATATVPCTGSFYVNWEDSGQGGDFDQDMWGILSYAVTPAGINIYTQIVGLSSANGQGFGYVISGTNKDGPHFHSGGYSFKYVDPTNVTVLNDSNTSVTGTGDINGSGGCNGCNLGDIRTHVAYTASAATVQLLNDPMWYASKYGAFVDDPTSPDGKPDDPSKWDKFINATGATGNDGTPDDYFFVTNPNQLVSSLQRAFSQIVAKVASGTAAAVVASAGEGSGAVYQAFYEPVHQELITPNRQARWLGTLQAFFIGPDGNLYEDSDQDGQLETSSDSQISFIYDTTTNVTKFNRTPDDGGNPHDLADLKPIWNARKTLAKPPSGVTVQQRGFSTGDTTKRYIFTWIDGNGDGTPTSSEIYDFTTAAIPSTDNFYFNLVASSAAPAAATLEAHNIIDWVRGEDLTGYRNRTLSYNIADGAAGAATQRLGDIIDSTPNVVATPNQAFDLLYGDQSYGVYRNLNACRRQVALVGANDGMLHAFNAGFYNVANQAFATSLNTTGCGTGSSGSTNNYALGEEIWAYVPQNLIPQLTWLTKDPPATNGYTHVYYVDGTPRVFDVNLPSAINHTCSGVVNSTTVDCSHWGTIAVVPFRLGGGQITVDIKGDGSVLRNYHSGYIIMDVTDPEVPPTLLGEITLPAGQLATSSPTIATIRKPDAAVGDPNSWFLVVGSGPDVRATVSSDTTANIFVYDLNNLPGYNASGVTIPTRTIPVTGATNSFVGDVIASDWNLDFQVEGLYFGTQQTTASADFNGGMFKLQTHSTGTGAPDPTLVAWTVYPMYSAASLVKKSISIRPTLGIDDNSTPYVFVGTGRLFASADLGTTSQQSIYGFKDKSETLGHPTGCSGDAACVLDVSSNLLSGGAVQTNGTVTGSTDSATTFTQLVAHAAQNCIGPSPPTPCYDGWELDLTTPVAGDTHSGSERVVSSQTLFGGQLFTSTYVPNTSLCGAIGQSYLYSQDYQTGTASPGNSTDFGTTTTGGVTTVNLSNTLGSGGLASSPSLIVHPGSGANGSATLQSCVQTSTGQIVCKDLNPQGLPNNGEVSWRQLLNNN
jgi:type IV pilus assembly protein PilY1